MKYTCIDENGKKGNMKYYNISVWYNVNGKLKNRVLARAFIY